MRLVVSNTTPIIALARLGSFTLLRSVFGHVHVPEAVHAEIDAGGPVAAGVEESSAAMREGWLVPHRVTPSQQLLALSVDLGQGEAESVALALELDAKLVLLDDRKARARAKGMGLNVTGTVGVLLLAQRLSLEVDLERSLDELRHQGFRLSKELVARIVKGSRQDSR